jgi:Kef-type K+ transport system membrane component KefB
VARRLGQPAVIGEIAAGLVLGPSVLGRIWPTAFKVLFHPSIGSLPADVTGIEAAVSWRLAGFAIS